MLDAGRALLRGRCGDWGSWAADYAMVGSSNPTMPCMLTAAIKWAATHGTSAQPVTATQAGVCPARLAGGV